MDPILKSQLKPLSKSKAKSKANFLSRRQSGQIIIEYLLLMLVTIGIAALFVRILVSRNPDEPGALFRRWDAVNQQIGKDDPEKP